MKSIKALVCGTTLAVGLAGVAGTNASAQSTYTVQQGDTLAKISQKYVGDFSLVGSIASANGIANKNLIYAGTQIIIPSKGQTVAKQAVSTQAVQQAPKAQVQVKQAQPAQKAQTQQSASTYKKSTYKKSTYTKPATTKVASSTAGSSSAKEWIANKESGGSYSARSASGKYVGRYQLDKSYLNGDYSAANQERVANNYVKQRYGSWANAKAFWVKNGWY